MRRYGRHRAGLCATVIHYPRPRAIREVGKAMGLSEDTLAALSSQIWGWSASPGIPRPAARDRAGPDDPGCADLR
jgi:DNA polymerase III alpha subunit